VPGLKPERAPQDERSIKFHCPHCNQKIGLKADYAGRKVRCGKCRQPLIVPEAPQPAREGASANLLEQALDGDSVFANQPVSGQPGSVPADDVLRVSPRETPSAPGSGASCPTCGTPHSGDSALCSVCGHTFSSGGGSGASRSVPTSTPLALAASVGFTVGGAVVWCVVAAFVGEGWLGFMAIGVCSLAGYGLKLFGGGKYSVGLGILAIFIALAGVLFAKVLIAKWVIMPELMSEMRETMDDAFDEQEDANEMSDEDVQMTIEDANAMFTVTLMQLVQDGEFDRDVAVKIVWYRNFMLDTRPEDPELASEIDRAEKRVSECLETWSPEKKEQVVREQSPNVAREAADAIMDSGVGAAFGFVFAFFAALSCQDFICVPLGLVCAYRLGSGKD
jgi:hypothetical protein